MSYFEVKNLYKDWGTSHIDFDMECDKGDMVCILGPSGIGKTTVLNIIAGLEKSDMRDGKKLSIFLDETQIDSFLPKDRKIGMVFQSGALFNNLNVVENVAYGLVSQGKNKSDAIKIASEYLHLFDLGGFDKRMPQTLSGGEKQRVALARTLIVQPKLVLLDEPFSALDSDLRKRMALQLKEWQKKLGFTAIMVTHDETEAQSIADKIIRLKKD